MESLEKKILLYSLTTMEIIEDPGEKLSVSLVSNARLYIQGKRINAHIQINKSVYTRIEKAGLKQIFHNRTLPKDAKTW